MSNVGKWVIACARDAGPKWPFSLKHNASGVLIRYRLLNLPVPIANTRAGSWTVSLPYVLTKALGVAPFNF